MNSLLTFITKSLGLTSLPGTLTSIEQHSDGVVTEFALGFSTGNNSYTRYFVIKPVDPAFPTYFMGSDNTSKDPKSALYFNPFPPLDPKVSANQNKFIQATGLISSKRS